MSETFRFTHIVSRSFVLNGKRYTTQHEDPLPPGKYKLVRATDTGRS